MPSFRALAFAGLLTALHTAVLASSSLPATGARWQGRTVRDEAAGSVSFLWEGVQASITVAGATSVSVDASSSLPRWSTFRVYVDGVPTSPNASYLGGERTVTSLVTGLGAGTHTILLYGIEDPITLTWPVLPLGNFTLWAFKTDGTFLAPPPARSRRLLIIGDSITAGNQIDPVTCADDHAGSYERLLCDAFSANCTTLAISGIGLFKNCPALSKLETMATLMHRTIVGDASSVWDDAAFVPDGVIIALGTNDFANSNTPAFIKDYTQTYTALLVNLTRTFNNAALPIFCAAGPITLSYAGPIADAIAAAAAVGVSNAHAINFSTPVDRCGHPPYSSHVLMAAQAQPTLARVLGWGKGGGALEGSIRHTAPPAWVSPPVRGWNSWTSFGCGITDADLRSTADAIVSSGLAAAGYLVVAPDNCWAAARAPNGTIIADPKTFPFGMAAPLAYIKSLGLRPGIYTAIGNTTCAHRPGSAGYERIDAATYASWGVEWVKIDNCNYPHWDPALLYGAWAAALDELPYRIPVAGKAVLNYSSSVAYTASRRVGWDVSASWASLYGLALMGEPFFAQARAGDASTNTPSFYTDIELLQVGHSGLTSNETAAHFYLWCAMHAPLMLSSRIETLTPEHIALLTNPEALAIDEDALAGQARRVSLALADDTPTLPLHPTVLSCSASKSPLAPGQGWVVQPVSGGVSRITLAPSAGMGAAGLCLQVSCDNKTVVVDACPAADACAGGQGALWHMPPSNATGTFRSALGNLGCLSLEPGRPASIAHGCQASWQSLLTLLPSGQVGAISQVPGDDFIGYPLCLDAFLPTHTEVWAAPLANGDVSVLLLNPTPTTTPDASVTAEWSAIATALGISPFDAVSAVRDVGARVDLGSSTGTFSATLAPHSALFLRATPSRSSRG